MAAHPQGSATAAIGTLAATLRRDAAAARQRRLIVLAGDREWCHATAAQELDPSVSPSVWLADSAPAAVNALPRRRAQALLGTEVGELVVDAHGGFDPDAFGLAAGTLRGGGLLWLLTPPLDRWHAFEDPEHARIAVAPYKLRDVSGRFLGRVASIVRGFPGLALVEQDAVPPPLPGPCAAAPPAATPTDADCRSEDQARAVAAVLKAALDHRRRPVVLTSDRGRGKSAAFGIAAARTLQHGRQRVVVTAPHLDAVQPVFAHAHRLLHGSTVSRAALRFGDARIDFVAPDELARGDQEAALVLVDEAAALPAPLLERLLRRHARIAFATTVHGYEGTGRGFALRFQRTLDRLTPGWRALRLETPIRWTSGDPVEEFVFRALLLDASPAPEDAIAGADPGSCTFERIERDALAHDEATLSELFGLLVLAHYRTRPYDLRHLLDGPNLELYVARHAGHVVGIAVIACEGGFDAATAHDVWAGRTRPHGHLVPESLAVHAGIEHAPTLRCARVMRVAVHPAVQRRGLGSRLLTEIADALVGRDVDYMASSFGATVELMQFWHRLAFTPVRTSFKRGTTSGAHSVIVMRSLSPAGHALQREARERLLTQLPQQLSDPLRALEPALAAVLLRRDDAAPPPEPDAADWKDLASFAHTRRLYAVCLAALWKLTCRALADPDGCAGLTEAQRDLLVMKVIQKRTWPACVEALGFSGREQATSALREAVGVLVENLGTEAARAEAQRLKQEN